MGGHRGAWQDSGWRGAWQYVTPPSVESSTEYSGHVSGAESPTIEHSGDLPASDISSTKWASILSGVHRFSIDSDSCVNGHRSSTSVVNALVLGSVSGSTSYYCYIVGVALPTPEVPPSSHPPPIKSWGHNPRMDSDSLRHTMSRDRAHLTDLERELAELRTRRSGSRVRMILRKTLTARNKDE